MIFFFYVEKQQRGKEEMKDKIMTIRCTAEVTADEYRYMKKVYELDREDFIREAGKYAARWQKFIVKETGIIITQEELIPADDFSRGFSVIYSTKDNGCFTAVFIFRRRKMHRVREEIRS